MDILEELYYEKQLMKQLNGIAQIVILVLLFLISIYLLVIMINSISIKRRTKRIEDELRIVNRELTHKELQQQKEQQPPQNGNK